MKRGMSICSLVAAVLVCGACQETTAPSNHDSNGCVQVAGTFNPAAPGFIVDYRSGVDPIATTQELEVKYSFSARHVYTALPGFAAELSPTALAGVRCEPTVAAITRDGIITFASR